jgi:hypothetical protein
MSEDTQATIEMSPNVVAALVQIIDLGSKAGAYQGGDITVVGEVREQLVMALKPYMKSEASDAE